MNIFETTFGILASIPAVWTVLGIALVLVVLAFTGTPLLIWTLAGAAFLYGLGAPLWIWVASGVTALVFNVRSLRRALVTAPIMRTLKTLEFLPTISETERVAIEAGTVWVDGELFSGKPDFDRLTHEAYPDLTEEERAFLDGPVDEVCRMTDDWEVHQKRDLPPQVWEYLKANRFFGMIIPKKYGGLGFSASANSAVVAKLASRSFPLAVTVMVPNSLGPAELLAHYGTETERPLPAAPGPWRGDSLLCSHGAGRLIRCRQHLRRRTSLPGRRR